MRFSLSSEFQVLIGDPKGCDWQAFEHRSEILAEAKLEQELITHHVHGECAE